MQYNFNICFQVISVFPAVLAVWDTRFRKKQSLWSYILSKMPATAAAVGRAAERGRHHIIGSTSRSEEGEDADFLLGESHHSTSSTSGSGSGSSFDSDDGANFSIDDNTNFSINEGANGDDVRASAPIPQGVHEEGKTDNIAINIPKKPSKSTTTYRKVDLFFRNRVSQRLYCIPMYHHIIFILIRVVISLAV
jgi:hypothetical protein